LPIASSRAQAIRAIPPVALGIEPIPPDLTNGMTKASWSVAGLTACHHRTSAEGAIMDACGARISQDGSRCASGRC
jgi:hypothetical protein